VKPRRSACTLKALYQQLTGDTEAHQRRIDAQFRRLPARRQAMIRMRLTGASYEAIGNSHGAINRASAQSVITIAMERIRKAIAGEPRYTHRGPYKQKGTAPSK